MNKRGASVWISAILYFGIGIVILTILLSAGLPVINKLRDKNVVIQSKEVMHTLDENIREVIKEGPGSQRVLTINLKKGSLRIDNDANSIIWSYDGANILISEPGLEVPEGKVIVLTTLGSQKKTYDINIRLNYADINADILTEGGGDLIGLTDLVIRNNGLGDDGRIQVEISETN